MYSRKTLIYLILTLNHSYPDYDFSCLRAHHFRKEHDVRLAKGNIDNLLLETSKVCFTSTLCECLCIEKVYGLSALDFSTSLRKP